VIRGAKFMFIVEMFLLVGTNTVADREMHILSEEQGKIISKFINKTFICIVDRLHIKVLVQVAMLNK
jgi:hypothetical protein